MRLLITGGAGFIGSNLTAAVCAGSHVVAVLDDLSTGRRANIPSMAELFRGDVRNEHDVRSALKRFLPSVVVHLAAQATVADSLRDPLHDASVNVLGTVNVLNQAALQGVKRVVLAASGGTAYGSDSNRIFEAGRTPTHPLSPYGCSKLAGELYARAFSSHYGFRLAVLRYANVYGPRQDPASEGGVVATFISRLMRGKGISINAVRKAGDAGCVRDYIYVEDVVRANLAAIGGAFDGKTVDVGTGVGTSTLYLSRAIARAVGVRPKISFKSPRAGDVPKSVLSRRAIAAVIGPATPLLRGLAQTVRWYSRVAKRANRNAS